MWKALLTAKNIITGILLLLAMGLLAFMYYGFTGVTSTFTLLALGFISGAIIVYVLTWLMTKLFWLIMKKRPLTYFSFCFVLSTVFFFVSLFNQGTFFGQTVPNPFLLSVAYHMTVTLFLIPKIDGHWNWYEVTETTTLDGEVIDENKYLTKEYTSGTTLKIVGQLVLSLIFAGLLYWNRNFAWLIYALEGGYSIYMVIRVILSYRTYF